MSDERAKMREKVLRHLNKAAPLESLELDDGPELLTFESEVHADVLAKTRKSELPQPEQA